MNETSDYTFAQLDYIKFMPIIDTNQHCGRLHECPLCGLCLWSENNQASMHWKQHGKEIEKRGNNKRGT